MKVIGENWWNIMTQSILMLDYHDIIITTGGSEAILFGFLSCLDAGDEVIIPEPFYANYNGFAVAAGVIVKPITSHIETGFALPPIEEFEKVITRKQRRSLFAIPIILPVIYTAGRKWKSFKQLFMKHNLYLFSDEAYREFCYEGEHFSAMHLNGSGGKCVIDGYDQ